MFIMDILVNVMFNKDCVECVIESLYRPGILQT